MVGQIGNARFAAEQCLPGDRKPKRDGTEHESRDQEAEHEPCGSPESKTPGDCERNGSEPACGFSGGNGHGREHRIGAPELVTCPGGDRG